MKIFINYDSKSESYRVNYHKCDDPDSNARELVVYKSYIIDRREADEFGGFFSKVLERRSACNCPRDKKVQSVEISAREFRRIREKK